MDVRTLMSQFNQTLGKIHASYVVVAQKYDMTYNSMLLLYMIHEQENITQKQVCDSMCLSKSTVHGALQDIVKRGYVSVVQGRNKKEKYIVMTAEGLTLAKNMQADVRRIEERVVLQFGEANMLAFLQQADALAKYMKQSSDQLLDEATV